MIPAKGNLTSSLPRLERTPLGQQPVRSVSTRTAKDDKGTWMTFEAVGCDKKRLKEEICRFTSCIDLYGWVLTWQLDLSISSSDPDYKYKIVGPFEVTCRLVGGGSEDVNELYRRFNAKWWDSSREFYISTIQTIPQSENQYEHLVTISTNSEYLAKTLLDDLKTRAGEKGWHSPGRRHKTPRHVTLYFKPKQATANTQASGSGNTAGGLPQLGKVDKSHGLPVTVSPGGKPPATRQSGVVTPPIPGPLRSSTAPRVTSARPTLQIPLYSREHHNVSPVSDSDGRVWSRPVSPMSRRSNTPTGGRRSR